MYECFIMCGRFRPLNPSNIFQSKGLRAKYKYLIMKEIKYLCPNLRHCRLQNNTLSYLGYIFMIILLIRLSI